MSKVIHKIKPNFNKFNSHSSSLLHRGQKSKDPYNNKRLNFNPARLLLKTLGTSRILNPRCSSTFSGYINNSKNIRITGFSSVFILLVLSALSVYPIVRNLNLAEAASPTDSTTTLNITTTNSANVRLLVKDASGTFASSDSSESLNFNVTTNNYTGYKLTLLGKDSTYDTLYYKSGDETIGTLTSINENKTSSGFSNGHFGYTLDGTNFKPAPNNETGDTIDSTNVANDTANTYTLGLGVKADYSTKTGVYTNTYVLTAVGNPTPYTLNFNKSTTDAVENMPSVTSDSAQDTKVALPTNVPTRTGYTFAGWCDTEPTANSNGSNTCSGATYQPSTDSVTTYYDFINRTAETNIATLYAVWTINTYAVTISNTNTTSSVSSLTIEYGGSATVTVTPNDGYYLSDVSCPEGYTCSGYNTGSSYTGQQTVTVVNNNTANGGNLGFTGTLAMANVGSLQNLSSSLCTSNAVLATDNRDNQDYVIQRLDDGNCWMMTNLNLGDTNNYPLVATQLDSTNTNIVSTVDSDAFVDWKKTKGSETYASPEYISVSGVDSVSGTAYGTLYNYCAASGNDSNACVYSMTSQLSPSYDICPAGWRLPTGGPSGELTVLYRSSNYRSYAVMRASITDGGLAFVLAGTFRSSTPDSQGTGGNYWSSTFTTFEHAMYRLGFSGSDVAPAESNTLRRAYGASIRCIMESKTIADATYMQDVTPTIVQNTADFATATLTDYRDSQKYTVTKIGGVLWMTRNLAIGCNGSGTSYGSSISSRTLTSARSNVSSDWSTPTELLSNASSSTLTADYTTARMQCSNTYGAYYNYAAASAGTITGESNSTEDVYNICPSGWTLPTVSQTTSSIGYGSVYTTSAKGSAFSTVAGGRYSEGRFYNEGFAGSWWTSTASLDNESDVRRAEINYSNNLIKTTGSTSHRAAGGISVRCIVKQ